MPRARKSRTIGTAAKAATPTRRRSEARLIKAALDLAAQQGWRNTSLGAIAPAKRTCRWPKPDALHRSKASLLRRLFPQPRSDGARRGRTRRLAPGAVI